MANPPDYAALKRSLCILHCLARGPASRAVLVDYVGAAVDDTSYGNLRDKRQKKAFENDIKRLHDLGVEYEYADKEYRLLSYGSFSPVGLSEPELTALAFLAETFVPSSVNGETVQALVRRVADWLPESQRGSIESRRQRWRVDLGRKDDDVILPEVQEKIERAIAQHRLLQFAYLSPVYADGQPRVHKVQPWYMTFDTVTRHQYLEAYQLEVGRPVGSSQPQRWVRYRIGRIVPDQVEILPDKFVPIPPKRRRHHLEYLLSPEVARLGEISRHFDDMEVHEPDASGWVRVTATTTDLFSALRQLLRYAHNCKVIGGSEAREQMQQLVQALARNYGVGQGEEESR